MEDPLQIEVQWKDRSNLYQFMIRDLKRKINLIRQEHRNPDIAIIDKVLKRMTLLIGVLQKPHKVNKKDPLIEQQVVVNITR